VTVPEYPPAAALVSSQTPPACSVVLAGIVARTLTPAALFEPRTVQLEMSTGFAAVFRSSMNSSFPPDGPLTRNSEMTMSVEAPAADTGTSNVPAMSAEARSECRIRRQRIRSCDEGVSELLNLAQNLGD
jgi:hypothetical protein